MPENSELTTILQLAGWLPRGTESEPLRAALGEDLLPRIQDRWEQALRDAARATSGRRNAEWLTWLGRQRSQGASLTWGFPGFRGSDAERWLGGRLVWWPRGIPLGSRVGLVSSRLGRRLNEKPAWFSALRSASSELDPAGDILLVAERTAAEKAVVRAAEMYELRLLRLFFPRASRTVMSWARDLRRRTPQASTAVRTWSAFLSPVCPVDSTCIRCDPELASTPDRDRSVVVLSDRLTALRIRPRGHLERLLRIRLREQSGTAAAIRLCVGPDLVRPRIAEALAGLGAVRDQSTPGAGDRPCYHPDECDGSGPSDPPVAMGTKREGHKPAPIVAIASSHGRDFLSHWTRRRDGPWPGEGEDAYLDRLLRRNSFADQSAAGVLLRIVEQRTILAAASTIRGRTPVVCFTEVPLAELSRRRVFRPHRGTWDYEPYGICIHRDWLEQFGARPVIYGDDTRWRHLPAVLRPFFQLRRTLARNGRSPIDWTSEREWRMAGDVNLAELPPQDGMLFVPTQLEAARFAVISPWPVVVLAE